MLILNQKEIELLVSPAEMVETVREAFCAYARRECVVPHRHAVENNGITALYMPCFASDVFGTKMLTLVPANRERGLPSIDGAVILNDRETGAICAMLDGKSVTAWRTGAVGALGTMLLSDPAGSTLGIIGCGVQGLHQAFCIMAVRPIRRIYLYSRSGVKQEFIEKLRSRMCAAGEGKMLKKAEEPEIIECASADELVASSEIVVNATYSEQPVLPAKPELLKGKCFVAVGSYKTYMRELPDELFSVVDEVYVDLPFACEESGDLSVPIQKGLLKEDEVKTIYSLFADGKAAAKENLSAVKCDQKEQDTAHRKTILFKTVGMSVMDLFAANYLYKKAQEQHRGLEVEF